MMRIAVLVKEVPDTWSDRQLDLETGLLDRGSSDPVPDESNERALESALQYKDADADTEVVLLSMGPESASKSLRKLLAMGADSAVLVSDDGLAGSDMVQTSRALTAALKRVDADLVIAGDAATDGRGGMVPAMVAELWGKPILPGLDSIEITAFAVNGAAQVDGGSLRISAPLPAVGTVTERCAEPRFANFKGIMQAKKKSLDTWSLSDLGVEVGPDAANVRSVMVAADARPAKQAGPKVEDDGTAAAQLAEFLSDNRLI